MNNIAVIVCLALSATALASPRLIDSDDAPRAKLVSQLRLLEDERPTLTVGKGLLIGGASAVGAGALVGGLALVLLDSAHRTNDSLESVLVAVGGMMVGVLGVVILVAGGVLLLTGMVCVLVKLHQQSKHDAQIDETRQRLEELDRAERVPVARSTPLERRPLPGFVLATF